MLSDQFESLLTILSGCSPCCARPSQVDLAGDLRREAGAPAGFEYDVAGLEFGHNGMRGGGLHDMNQECG